MKRFRKILIILLILLIVVLCAWALARRKAVRNGQTPPSFRSFLSIGNSKNNTGTTGNNGTNTSDFTDDENIGTNTGSSTPKTKTSIFTNSGLNPTGIEGGGAQGPSEIIVGGTGQTTVGQTGGTGVIGTTGGQTTTAECSDTDLTIDFTPDEIARLNALKTRFFALAQDLNTDSELATEITNYDIFKSKSDKLTELYNYCKSSPVYTGAQATPVVASQQYGTTVPGNNGAINYRVPTPFWHEITKDNQAFVHQGINWKGIFSDPDLVFPERSIEHALRINLW